MFTRIAQEITQLLADEPECSPSATRRLAKARLVASIAEGLRHVRTPNMAAGLSEGLRAAFLDARMSPEKWHLVVSALSRDPADQAEMSSAAALLDGVDAESSPPPRELLAKAVTTFVKSAADHATPHAPAHAPVDHAPADHAPAIGGRAWRRPALLALATSLAASILLMSVVPGLLSPAGTEPTGSARPAAQSATTGSEHVDVASGADQPIILPPEPIERGRSILARGETSAVSCDEVATHGASEVDKAKDGASPEASCGSPAVTADAHSTKPQRTSHQSSDFRLGMIVDSLYAIPDGLNRAVSLIGKLGKKTLDMVDPRCIVGQLQMDASRSRGTSSSILHNKSGQSLPRGCANHFPITFPVAQSRVENKERVQ